MRILSIDTSCDETCIAILEIKNSKIEIKSNIVSSQVKIHKKYGGVFPSLAKREHQKNLILVLTKALKVADLLKKKVKKEKYSKSNKIIERIFKREPRLLEEIKKFFKKYETPKIDLIAVTKGPGLEPCLWTGINFAKLLSLCWKKPIISVNHLEGHIFANWIKPIRINPKFKNQDSKIIFPAIALIASGGHTELILIKKIKKYKLLGETRDDAAGECLDKIAKILNLPYPGGPEIEKIAKMGNKENFKLPSPMIFSKNYDFSFSGLKTAVLYLAKKLGKKKIKKLKIKASIAASAQQAIFDVLISKTLKAVKEKKAKTLLTGGGVFSNQALKKQFKSEIKNRKIKIAFFAPEKKLCTDNAAMIGVAAYFNKDKKINKNETKKILTLKANANLNF